MNATPKLPRVTVVVVPRESFAHAARSLASLYENAGFPFDLVYVDGGMPGTARRAIERERGIHGFTIVDAGRNAIPNHARNTGVALARTEYVVIVDNDVVFGPNWLSLLVTCADEERADVVGPLICIGDPPFRRIHSAGGDASVEGPHGVRSFSETHRFIDLPLTVTVTRTLSREPMGLVEFHCMLIRRAIFERVGPLDERLESAAEHSDFCLSVRDAGGTIWFEPQSMVNQVLPLPFPHDLASLPFFLSRWSNRRNRASLARLCAKHGIAPNDAGVTGYAAWLGERRELMFAPILKPLRAAAWLAPLRRLRLILKRRLTYVGSRPNL
jgi:GT2 family glycosyltransferase